MNNQHLDDEIPPGHLKIYELLELEELDTEEIKIVLQIIANYCYIFTNTITRPIEEHKITTKNEKLIKKSYKKITDFSAQQQENIFSQITTLLSIGTIIPSDSKYNNEIIVSRQRLSLTEEPQWRITVPLTSLNRKIISIEPAFQKLSEIRGLLSKNLYFSIMNLEELYGRILLHPEDASKTAFTTPVGKYQFTSLLPSIKGSQVTFINLLRRLFPRWKDENIVFLPLGIIIASPSLIEHKKILTNTFHTLLYHVITINPSKIKLFRSIVDCYEFVNQSMGIQNFVYEPQTYTGKILLQLVMKETGFDTILSEYHKTHITPLSNSSRTYNGQEQFYGYHDKIGLAIIHSIRRFKGFITNNSILFYDGRNSLEWLETISRGFKHMQWLLDIEKVNWSYIPSDEN